MNSQKIIFMTAVMIAAIFSCAGMGHGGTYNFVDGVYPNSACRDCWIAGNGDYWGKANGSGEYDSIDWLSGKRTKYLIAFDDMIGTGTGQIQPYTVIVSAELWLYSKDLTNSASVYTYYLRKEWADGGEGNQAVWDEIDSPNDYGATWYSATEIYNSGGNITDPWSSPGASSLADRSSLISNTFVNNTVWQNEEYVLVASDLTDAVQAWIDGSPHYGLLIEIPTYGYQQSYYSNNASVDKRPKLVVTTTSPPMVDLVEGWNMFSTGSSSPVPWSSYSVSDGSDTLVVSSAEAMGWIQGTIYYFDDDWQGYRTVPGESDDVEWHRGYWLWADRPGLKLILQ
jgi:hypothetical protein